MKKWLICVLVVIVTLMPLVSSCAWKPPEEGILLDLYIPAPPMTPAYNAMEATAKMLNDKHEWIQAAWKSYDTPDSVNDIFDELTPEEKKYALPWPTINFSFAMARAGAGPEIHKYTNEQTDLKFVGVVDQVAWGMLTADPDIKTFEDLAGKRIGTTDDGPGLPQVVLTEILRAAGVLEQVEYVPMGVLEMPGKWGATGTPGAEIDALWFGQAWENKDGDWTTGAFPFAVFLNMKQTYWVNLSQDIVDGVNAANVGFKLGAITIPKGSITVPPPEEGEPPEWVNPPEDATSLQWASALVAWDSTEEEVVYELLKFLFVDNLTEWSEKIDRPVSIESAARTLYPGLTEDAIHAGALKFYKEHGVEVKIPE